MPEDPTAFPDRNHEESGTSTNHSTPPPDSDAAPGNQRHRIPDDPNALDHFLWESQRHTVPILGLLLIVILVVIGLLYKPLFQDLGEKDTQSELPTAAGPIYAISSDTTSKSEDLKLYFLVEPEGLKTTDIMMMSPLTSESTNLTNSPDYSEQQPVLSPDGKRIAFLAIGTSGQRSIRVFKPGEGILDVTYASGSSRFGTDCRIAVTPPQIWSPDSKWIAFFAECEHKNSKTIEMFVARSSGTEVRMLTDGTGDVTSAHWLTSESLVYGTERPDGVGVITTVNINKMEPRVVATVMAQD